MEKFTLCKVCGGVAFLRCNRCKKVYYCSEFCFNFDIARHQNECSICKLCWEIVSDGKEFCSQECRDICAHFAFEMQLGAIKPTNKNAHIECFARLIHNDIDRFDSPFFLKYKKAILNTYCKLHLANNPPIPLHFSLLEDEQPFDEDRKDTFQIIIKNIYFGINRDRINNLLDKNRNGVIFLSVSGLNIHWKHISYAKYLVETGKLTKDSGELLNIYRDSEDLLLVNEIVRENERLKRPEIIRQLFLIRYYRKIKDPVIRRLGFAETYQKHIIGALDPNGFYPFIYMCNSEVPESVEKADLSPTSPFGLSLQEDLLELLKENNQVILTYHDAIFLLQIYRFRCDHCGIVLNISCQPFCMRRPAFQLIGKLYRLVCVSCKKGTSFMPCFGCFDH